MRTLIQKRLLLSHLAGSRCSAVTGIFRLFPFRLLSAIILIFSLPACKKDNPEVPDLSNRITIGISEPTYIGYSTVQISGILGKTYGETVQDHGHVWDTLSGPEIEDNHISYGSRNAATTYTSDLNGLTPGKTWYVRAYFKIFDTEVYSNEVSFSLKERGIPVASTDSLLSRPENTILAMGKILDIKDDSLLQKGFCWSLEPMPEIDDFTMVNLQSLASYQSLISGLLLDTVYYFRAYATNSLGTGYGEELSIRTTNGLPVVITSEPDSVSAKTALGGGEVTDNGGFEISSRGLCWSTEPAPDINDNISTEGSGMGVFESEMAGLELNTLYYVRAWAQNSIGISYGNEFSFITKDGVIKITTKNFSEVSGSSAKSGGDISDDGGLPVSQRGICWSLESMPTIDDNITTDGSGTGSFESILENLDIDTRYYVRAYATNEKGIEYGSEKTFTTTRGLISIQTGEITQIRAKSAHVSAVVVSDGGVGVTERGICWSTSTGAGIETNCVQAGSGTGSYSVNLTDLPKNMEIYVNAYATNASGTYYGEEKSFSTLDGIIRLTTIQPYDITATSAMSGANISDNGGVTVLEKGLCWALTPQPDTDDNFIEYTGNDNPFAIEVTGLAVNTTYFLRAYAKSDEKTFYGDEIPFTSLDGSVTLTTLDPSFITANSAVSGGEITYTGGAEVSEKGLCWSVSPSPDINDFSQSAGSGSETFTLEINNLINNTTYYVRSYAISAGKTSYGNQVIFQTREGNIKLVTRTVSSIGLNSASSGGFITDDGGAEIIAKGVCWSKGRAPTVNNNFTNDGSGRASYFSNVVNLDRNTLYYIRAYAENATGISYGDELSFTSLSGAVELTTAEISDLTANSVVSGGNILSNGGIPVGERGVCWSKTPGPTTANQKIANGSGTGSFSVSLSQLENNQTYYLRAYAINAVDTWYGNEISFTTRSGIITLTTKRVTNIGTSTATSGGIINDNGGSPVLAKGICWDTNPNPSIFDNTTNNGSGSQEYISQMTGLPPESEIFVRAYATNAYGTRYGQEISFTNLTSGTITDARDGNTYNWVKLGDQFWLTENMAWLPSVTPATEGSNTEAYYYVYDYDDSSVAEAKQLEAYSRYGVLYNSKAAAGACPSGWHLPTDSEWEELATFISTDMGGYSKIGDDWLNVGTHLKSEEGWVSGNGTDDYSFRALPGGARSNENYFFDSRVGGYWWSSTPTSVEFALYRWLFYSDSELHRGETVKELGVSVRCIRD